MKRLEFYINDATYEKLKSEVIIDFDLYIKEQEDEITLDDPIANYIIDIKDIVNTSSFWKQKEHEYLSYQAALAVFCNALHENLLGL